jgi:hypothetical protein
MLWRTVFVTLLAVSTAAASPAAEKLFQDGRALMNEGKLAAACDAFRRSNELEPRVGTLLNLANCEDKRGRVATAWATFIEARTLAKRQNDPRAAEADKRASSLSARLPYLTIRVSDAGRAPGLVLRRNNTDVPAAEEGHDVPLDPGSYTLDASAPGYQPWSKTIELREGARVAVDVPALTLAAAAAPTATPAATTTTPPPAIVSTAPEPAHAGRRFAAGAAIGMSSDGDLLGGLRGVLTLANVGAGSIRLVPSVFYTRYGNPSDVYQHFDLFAIGLAGEYTAPVTSQFYVASGLGFGVDVIKDSYDNPLATHAWVSARVSPTYRVGPIDIGLHLQLVVATSVVGLGELGVDYFF